MVQLSKPQIYSVLLEILKVVDKFCKEKGLRYSIAYGTLLGSLTL